MLSAGGYNKYLQFVFLVCKIFICRKSTASIRIKWNILFYCSNKKSPVNEKSKFKYSKTKTKSQTS